MSAPIWLCSCLAHYVIVIAIAVVGLRSVCTCCSALVVGLVDFLLFFVLRVRTLRAEILSISSTTTSTRPLSRPLPTPQLSPLCIIHKSVDLRAGCSQFPVADNGRGPVQQGQGQKFMIIVLMVHLSIDIAGLLLCCCLCVTIATIAIVRSCSGFSCCCCGVPVALEGKGVLTILLIADVSILLLMIKDCRGAKQTNRC